MKNPNLELIRKIPLYFITQATALPMLFFTMKRFYEVANANSRIFTRDTYEEIGGINRSLGLYADEIYDNLNVDEK